MKKSNFINVGKFLYTRSIPKTKCSGMKVLFPLFSRELIQYHPSAFQSRVGPVQWLKPYTDEVLVDLGQKGLKSLLAVPVRYAF